MKTYYICAALFFVTLYAVFHFGFRKGGAEQLYRINDELAFAMQPESENYNDLTIHGFKRTNKLVCFICGEYERDDAKISMVNVKYRDGDWVYTDFPQHEQARTDIVNLRTGETIEASIPADFKFGGDLAKLAEYQTRGLGKADEFKLTQEYVQANFESLSSYTNRCVYAHIIFAVAAFILAFPNFILSVTGAFFNSLDPTDPANFHRN